MRQSLRISAAVLTLASVVCFANVASAQDAAPAGAPAAAAPGAPGAPGDNRDRPRRDDDEDEDDLKHFALTINPLSLILTRVGVNFEYMFAKHHGLGLNPFFQSISVGDEPIKTSYTNFGAELGYRFYTGSRGANGFFVGPFATFISSTAKASTATTSAESSISIYGGGVDIGGQHVFRSGFTIGAGGGLMYVTASESNTTESSVFKVSGVLPRFLFTLGWSF